MMMNAIRAAMNEQKAAIADVLGVEEPVQIEAIDDFTETVKIRIIQSGIVRAVFPEDLRVA